MNVTPLEHVLVHVSDTLATDNRVQELGLTVTSGEVASAAEEPVVVVEGNLSTEQRKRNVVAVVAEVLATYGWRLPIEDRTTVTTAVAPQAVTEDL
jgi:hypothetical protein